MTRTAVPAPTWSDLGLDRRGWVVSGVFAVDGSTYQATFADQRELGRFLDFALASPVKPATTRLYLHPDEVPARPERQVSTLRFQFDPEHRVGAAVLLVVDGHGDTHRWRTIGTSDSPGVVLAHDSWNEHETRFPPESFITLPQLRATVLAWAFGDAVLPLDVAWTSVPDVDWL